MLFLPQNDRTSKMTERTLAKHRQLRQEKKIKPLHHNIRSQPDNKVRTARQKKIYRLVPGRLDRGGDNDTAAAAVVRFGSLTRTTLPLPPPATVTPAGIATLDDGNHDETGERLPLPPTHLLISRPHVVSSASVCWGYLESSVSLSRARILSRGNTSRSSYSLQRACSKIMISKLNEPHTSRLPTYLRQNCKTQSTSVCREIRSYFSSLARRYLQEVTYRLPCSFHVHATSP